MLSFPMFFGVDFLFGSIATTIAAIALGGVGGGLVALIAGTHTWLLWGHPYAAIIFAVEAFWLGWFWQRGRQNLVARDMVFWCAIGMPLVFLFYSYGLQLSLKTVALIALKQSANGIFCTAVVAFLMLHTPLGAWAHDYLSLPKRKRSIQQIAFNFLVAIVFLPMLGLTFVDSRFERSQLDIEWKNKLQTAIAQVVQTVEVWQRLNPGNFVALEQSLTTQPFEIPIHLMLRSRLARIEIDRGANFPGWENLGNPHRVGAPAYGERHFEPDSDTKPDIGQARRDLSLAMPADAIADAPIFHALPRQDAPKLAAWRQSYYSISFGPTARAPFEIRVSASAALQIERLESLYIRDLSALLAIAIVVAILATTISHYFAAPLRELSQLTTDIPEKLTDDRELVWPRFALDEVEQLSRNFQLVAEVLQTKFQEVYRANENLESRVRERTAELESALVELQNTQVQLVHSEKMSSLGQLVAGVAHEINNPVSFIHGNLVFAEEHATVLLEALRRYRVRDPHVSHAPEWEDLDLDFVQVDFPVLLESMRQGTQRIRAIVNSLRSFSRLDESKQKTVDPIDGIEDSLQIVQHRLQATRQRPAIQLVRDYENLPPIACYPGQLNQVFFNIVANAIDALENTAHYPTITIEARQYKHSDGDCGVEIEISDNGCGIPSEIRDRIFEPFFTTKPVGSGTGMGLAVCHSVVVGAHGGQLEVESRLGKTTFIVSLPNRVPESPSLPDVRARQVPDLSTPS